jgi:uncharacterized protein
VPSWADGPGLVSITRTAEELSIVCATARVPLGVRVQGGWRAFQLHGPIPFSETGVLSSLLAPLAAVRVSIFAVSTFDTDYVLVPEGQLDAAARALADAGHDVG